MSPIADLRLYRSSMRVLVRPPVYLLFVLALVVVVALSLVSRSYARDQLSVADDAIVMTCEELQGIGVGASDCPGIQETQMQSAGSLRTLADRIGPEAATLGTTRGSFSFAAGHGLSAIGLVVAALGLTVAYSSESRSGVAQLRESLASPFAVNLSRIAAVVTVWVVWLVATAVAVGAFAGSTPSSVLERYLPNYNLMVIPSLAARVGIGSAGVVVLCAFLLALRKRITARPAVVALVVLGAVVAACVLSSALPALATPVGAMLAAQVLGQQYTFMDHLPFAVDGARYSGPLAASLVAGWAVVAVLVLWSSCRRSDLLS